MTETNPPADQDATAAFEAMNRRLAGMSAAIDGFAARFVHLQERDYSADLARIDERFERLREAINTLNLRPAMALTPEDIASQVDAAARRVKEIEQEAWSRARQQLNAEVRSIRDVVFTAREASKQNRWLMYSGAMGVALGLALMYLTPRIALEIVPDSWLWREQAAVKTMNRDGWTAGQRLMQVYDQNRWEEVAYFLHVSDEERAKFVDCAKKAEETGSEASCSVEVSSEKGR